MLHRFLRPKSIDSRSETIWLTIYADMITNLALVFLALFGLTVMGEDAVAKAVQSMKLEDIQVLDDVGIGYDFEDVAPVLRAELGRLSNVNVEEVPGVVRIEFGENILFPSGHANLLPSAGEPLKKVAGLLKIIPQTVVVEGHTDNVLLKGGPYRDNWELSLARAMSVVRFLEKEGRLASPQLAAAAYGPHRPRASNLTSAGRRANRRVEIALYKDFPLPGASRD